MNAVSFQQNPLWLNTVVFTGGAILVWLAGTRLSRYADAISERTGLGQAFIGALLLGGITSLPEVATTLTATVAGNVSLAVNNVFGSIALNVAILAVADAVSGSRALSRIVGASVVLLQGTLLVALLAVTVAAITVGSFVVFGVDVWTGATFAGAVLGLYSIKRYEEDPQWHPEPMGDIGAVEAAGPEVGSDSGNARGGLSEVSQQKLYVLTAAAGAAVIAGGYLVAQSADALSTQTGLGASFVGAIFVAITTNLPELSTTLEAVRLGRHRMAFSNIFGTNLFDVALLFLADLVFTGGAVLEQVGSFAQFGALLGLVLTTVYLAGILRRGGRTVLRMGLDSILVLAIYLVGVGILYTLR